MPKKLYKLVVTASTTTRAVPTVKRYLYTSGTAAVTDTSITIAATSFFTDSGTAAAAIATAAANNGYYMLYVNGQLQQSGIYAVGAAGANLVISTPATAPFTIPASGVVTLETTNFAPTSTTVITG